MSDKKIRILDYNIFQRPPCFSEDFREPRLTELIKRLTDFDILCFQEMFGTINNRLDRMIYEAELQGFFVAQPPMHSFFSPYLADSGLLILSKYPIVKTEFQPFMFGDFPDNMLAFKGVLYAKIQLENGKHLHVFTTHLQANYEMSNFWGKMKQIIETKQFIDKIKKEQWKEGELIVFTGDLNANHKQPLIDQKKVKFVDSDHIDCVVKQMHEPTQTERYNLYQTLVNILANKSMRNEEKKPDYNVLNVHEKYCEKKGIGLLSTVGNTETNKETGEEVPFDTILTEKESWTCNKCLDYIFVMIPSEQDKTKIEEKIDFESFQIERFEIKHPLFTQLSDHYGLSIQIIQ